MYELCQLLKFSSRPIFISLWNIYMSLCICLQCLDFLIKRVLNIKYLKKKNRLDWTFIEIANLILNLVLAYVCLFWWHIFPPFCKCSKCIPPFDTLLFFCGMALMSHTVEIWWTECKQSWLSCFIALGSGKDHLHRID